MDEHCSMKVTREREYEIDFLKSIAVVLVVVGHAISFYSNYYSIPMGIEIVQNIIYAVHVPLFFVIAGYLCKCPKNFGRWYYWKKIRRIIIPYYFFAILKLIYSNFISKQFTHGNSFSEQLVSAFIVGDMYWFCYTIFIFYLVAPVFWKCSTYVIKGILYIVIVFNTVLFYFDMELTTVFQISHAAYYIFFFCAGMYFERVNFFPKFKNMKYKNMIATFVMILSLLLKKYLRSSPIINYSLSITLMILMYNFSLILSKKRILQRSCNMISKYSLQIMFMDSFNKVVLFKIFTMFFEISFVWVFVIIGLNIAISCVCCRIMERIPCIAEMVGLELKLVKN